MSIVCIVRSCLAENEIVGAIYLVASVLYLILARLLKISK